ncbi:MAG: hypothetical protein OXH02_16065 [Gemmatimonadetes bacterium]|nr:hypothetical protein [Gemmatimonadota bacterium]
MGVYEELGVRPFINAPDHYTRYGGSIMWPCAVDRVIRRLRELLCD